MNIEDGIKHSLMLQSKIAKLEEELASINEDNEKRQGSCEHIHVFLGYFDFQYTMDRCRCLRCSKIEKSLYYETKFIIHAEDYLPLYDVKDKAELNNKFESI